MTDRPTDQVSVHWMLFSKGVKIIKNCTLENHISLIAPILTNQRTVEQVGLQNDSKNRQKILKTLQR